MSTEFYFEIQCWKLAITPFHGHRNTQQWQVGLKSVWFWILPSFKNVLKFTTNFTEFLTPGNWVLNLRAYMDGSAATGHI